MKQWIQLVIKAQRSLRGQQNPPGGSGDTPGPRAIAPLIVAPIPSLNYKK